MIKEFHCSECGEVYAAAEPNGSHAFNTWLRQEEDSHYNQYHADWSNIEQLSIPNHAATEDKRIRKTKTT